ncbi:YggS family pyridoxal phosphate-dependent enzyme [Sphingomicrobium sediminis]|uniref:Pyridoxal phosphate homeostasis protein n=1 Tax=Sphingomicrobium sediminis TaxID=2950949 RepID=A0A9X2J2A1_9SPHN|nr:YggS family pyridoxal phosphate-dependent enzyme [Sphingomicrobium sediminis]MCM8558068.1 YggS family pyridoxal phosphate-dependent enzyme [Sphingomicrobium sediminis]
MASIQDIQDQIALAAKRAGRKDLPTLIAVSKKHDADAIRPLLEAGHRDFGESRVQEAQDKWPGLLEEYPDARVHMIGQLQSNKAADAMALCASIHSLDRMSLLKSITKEAEKTGNCPDLFVQVNIGGEEQKGGVAVDGLGDFLAKVRERELPLKGLMCIPPADLEASPFFALMAELARRHDVTGLSMGMSGDYEDAVMLGATHLRIGSAIFGERPA